MGRRRVGAFSIDCECASIRSPERFASGPRLLVDTGSELTWISGDLLRQIGVRPVKKDLQFVMADGRTIMRSVGYAVLRAGAFETVDEVVFGEPGDLSLLGARTLEGFGARVDARAKRLVASGPLPAALANARA